MLLWAQSLPVTFKSQCHSSTCWIDAENFTLNPSLAWKLRYRYFCHFILILFSFTPKLNVCSNSSWVTGSLNHPKRGPGGVDSYAGGEVWVAINRCAEGQDMCEMLSIAQPHPVLCCSLIRSRIDRMVAPPFGNVIRASSISSVRCSLAVYKRSFWSSMFVFLVNYPFAYHVFGDRINHRSNRAWDLDLRNSLWRHNCSSLHIPQKLHSWFTFDLCHGTLLVIPSHAYNTY